MDELLPGIVEPPPEPIVLRFMIPGWSETVRDERTGMLRTRLRATVSKNEMHVHMPSTPRGAKILTAAARTYMRDVARIAAVAAANAGWPANLCAPRRVLLTPQIYGSRHDSGAANDIIRDALEGVLYRNDNVVEIGRQMRPQPAPFPYVMVTAELLEVWPPLIAARRLREAQLRDGVIHQVCFSCTHNPHDGEQCARMVMAPKVGIKRRRFVPCGCTKNAADGR